MQSGLVYIIQSLVDLYLIAVALRIGMQWVRADFRNPIVQFVLNITNPLVLPVRRFVPALGRLDSATLLVYFLLQWAATGLLTQITCVQTPDVLTVMLLALIRSLRLLLNVYFFVVFGYVLLSWVAQGSHNPSIAMLWNLLRGLAQPVLEPIQKIIPPIAGLDLSPIFLLLGLGAITRMLLGPAQQFAGSYICPLAGIL